MPRPEEEYTQKEKDELVARSLGMMPPPLWHLAPIPLVYGCVLLLDGLCPQALTCGATGISPILRLCRRVMSMYPGWKNNALSIVHAGKATRQLPLLSPTKMCQ